MKKALGVRNESWKTIKNQGKGRAASNGVLFNFYCILFICIPSRRLPIIVNVVHEECKT